jgi:uroporphyrinogen decarboxylase
MKPLAMAMDRKLQKAPPVWMMRQAGRYHQHYQNLRKQHSFMELCKNPELAAEVAWGPVQDFDFDVSILFSDLLFPLEALGMGLEYTDHGPRLEFHLDTESIQKLTPWQEALPQLEFQRQAVRLTREKIPANKSVIGFVGGPWTLYVYAVEGSHAGSLIQSKKQPQLFSSFTEILLPLLIENIKLQLDGGAETVMIFDTAAGELSPRDFQKQIEPLLVKLAKIYPGKLGYYSKGTQPAHLSSNLLSAPWAGIGVDHRWDLPKFLTSTNKGFVQGNFDQTLLHLPLNEFEARFREYLKPYQDLSGEQRAGWVCGLGHGVLPQTPEQNVRRFVEIVREVF